MLTLDEAIKHCEEKAEANRGAAESWKREGFEASAADCEECAAEHEQLANWLKELKELRTREALREMDKLVLKPNVQLQDLLGIPDACRNCSNHPSNGGSGICHCINGLTPTEW